MSRVTPEQLEEWLREVMPVSGATRSLELTSVAQAGDGDLRVTLRLIGWDVAGPDPEVPRTIRDVKEQEVLGVREPYRDEPERVKAALTGWSAALEEVLPGIDATTDLMPAELWILPLELRRAHSVEDFKAACLARSRLGKLLKAS